MDGHAVQRVEPAYRADERPMLEAWLDYHRATLELKCSGLDDEQLRLRAVAPSSMSLLGLVRHLAEVERYWFREIFAGEDVPALFSTEEHPDADFDDVDEALGVEAFAAWRNECDLSRAIAADVADLDAVSRREKHGQHVSMRWILTHLVEEYARHNGHADLIRERVDGSVGE